MLRGLKCLLSGPLRKGPQRTLARPPIIFFVLFLFCFFAVFPSCTLPTLPLPVGACTSSPRAQPPFMGRFSLEAKRAYGAVRTSWVGPLQGFGTRRPVGPRLPSASSGAPSGPSQPVPAAAPGSPVWILGLPRNRFSCPRASREGTWWYTLLRVRLLSCVRVFVFEIYSRCICVSVVPICFSFR